RGERRRWQFQPFWLRVVLEEREETNRLVLTSHGREGVVGGFLAPAERKSLAVALKNALHRWRQHIRPEPGWFPALQAQHVRHVVKSRAFGGDPARRADDAAGEDLPAAGAVRELDALGGSREHHRVLARDVAATQCGEADIAGPARPGVAVAHTLALGGALDPP